VEIVTEPQKNGLWHLLGLGWAMTDPLMNVFYIFLIVFGTFFIYNIGFYVVRKHEQREERIVAGLLTRLIYYPGMIFVITVSLWSSTPFIRKLVDQRTKAVIDHVMLILLILTTGFLLIRIITFLRELFIHLHTEKATGYSLRKAKTKFQLIQRIINTIIIITTVALILMTFNSVRQIGSTLLASAGVVGIVIGFAAQKSLGTFFAGLQIALAQPIRIDDTVVVEGQFGTIGEINLTYVIVNSWDGRRIVVPINYFLEKPFENWTRESPEVIGKVRIYADYSLPVEKVREELHKLISGSPLWDTRKWGLLITSASDHTIEVRATMSARDSDDAYDLECLVREHLISYIRDNFPQCLPRYRVSLEEREHLFEGH
jgi:small-conductance mechanosensitive channel